MYDGVYAVLNDATWVDRLERSPKSRAAMSSVKVASGNYYYGGRGSWGIVDYTPDGKFRASSLVPADAPAWTRVTPLNNLLPTSKGMFFYELNGLVFWNFSTKKNSFFPVSRLSAAFPVGDRIFVSSQDLLIREVLTESETTRIAPATGLEGLVVVFAAPFDKNYTLVASNTGGLYLFDGKTALPWEPEGGHNLHGRITAMEHLVEGGVAIAIEGKGIYLYDSDSNLKWSLEFPGFQRIETMAAGEAGVLWVAGGNALHRVFYHSPLTSFGQHLGLTAIWPQIAAWNEKILVCTSGSLFEMVPASPGKSSRFRVVATNTERQANALATNGPLLVIGDNTGVYTLTEDYSLVPILQIANVAGLEFISPDTCVVLGSNESTALKYANGRWTECTQRIQGIGDSPVIISKSDALWVEMGGDLVARISLTNGKLEMKYIDAPSRGQSWTNISSVQGTIVFSGANGQRSYYSEKEQHFVENRELDELLNRSPFWLLRITEDEAGILWATHPQGIVTFTPNDGDYLVDSSTFDMHNDSYPVVRHFAGNDTWIRASRALYHVEREYTKRGPGVHIGLVSLIADHQNLELMGSTGFPAKGPQFSFEDNSLSFRFFSGTYAWRFPPAYEYRLGAAESWTTLEPSLFLRLPKLRDGAYRLEVRQSGPNDQGSSTFTFPFEIKPPWYRTTTSFGLYGLLFAIALAGVARWMMHRSLEKNAALERLVRERTLELESTMEKLGEKTMNSAILSERSRLAGEIHDSVQQGLSGVMLLLDTAMTQNVLTPELSSQLAVMRKMLSYSREEVQQAVWNLESPLLQNSNLSDALRKLAGYINSGSHLIKFVTKTESTRLDPDIQHNLLRIAQEGITNAVKHAEATHIEVSLDASATSVFLSITDDGKGFNPASSSKIKGHFGLRGLHSRAKSIGAQLKITSIEGKGTTIAVTAPLREHSTDEFHSQV